MTVMASRTRMVDPDVKTISRASFAERQRESSRVTRAHVVLGLLEEPPEHPKGPTGRRRRSLSVVGRGRVQCDRSRRRTGRHRRHFRAAGPEMPGDTLDAAGLPARAGRGRTDDRPWARSRPAWWPHPERARRAEGSPETRDSGTDGAALLAPSTERLWGSGPLKGFFNRPRHRKRLHFVGRYQA